MRIFTDQDDGASVSLVPDDVFQIRLMENPTTGFRWRLSVWDSSILELMRDTFVPSDSSQHGSGGQHVWEFVARGPGHNSLQMTYRRAWGAANPAKAFSLHVFVT